MSYTTVIRPNAFVLTTGVGGAIRDTANHDFDLITAGLLAGDAIDLPQVTLFFENGLNQGVTVSVSLATPGAPQTYAAGTVIYSGTVAAGGVLALVPEPNVGAGAAADVVYLPILAATWPNLVVRVAAAVAPVSGALTVTALHAAKLR